MKKFVCVALACAMVLSMVGCASQKKEVEVETTEEPVSEIAVEEGEKLKVGLVCLHDSESSYDLNFIEAFEAACEENGAEPIIKTNIPETNECYEACLDLVDRGCDVVFGDSFGFESFMIQAANEHPEVEFCHATGTMAHTEGLSNYHNAFASIYEGRYLAGVAAGMKLKELVAGGADPKVGYCSAFQYQECISGYTAWFLGVRSIVPEATMEVISTGTWYSESQEKECTNKLIADGCVLISGHADSSGAPAACEEAGVPFTFYNGDITDIYPTTCIISTKIDWKPYFCYMIGCLLNGEEIAIDWTGTTETGSVVMTELNENVAAEGTAEKLTEVKEKLKSGEIKVFDTNTFTVNGEKLESYIADVDTDSDYTPDTEVISDGYFHESEYRSAPYWDILIDGVTVLTGN